MNRIRMGLRGKNGISKMEMAQQIVHGLNRVAGMDERTSLLMELNAAIAGFSEAHTHAQFGDRRAIEWRKRCEKHLEQAIRHAALAAEKWSLGEEELLAQIGFETRNTNNTAAPVSSPELPKAQRTDASGELKLTWKPVANSRNYLVQIATKTSRKIPNWNTAVYSTKARCVLQDLKPGKVYQIRIIALGAVGLSAPSQVLEMMAA